MTASAALQDAIEQIAVANFVGGARAPATRISSLDLDVNSDAVTGKKEVMAGIVNSTKLNRLHRDVQALDKVRTEITITTAVRKGVRRSISTIRDTTARPRRRRGAAPSSASSC